MNPVFIPSERTRSSSACQWARILRRTGFFFCVLLFCLALQAQGADSSSGAVKLEEMVSPDTLFFMKCSGLDRMIEKGQSLDLIRLWSDPEVQGFFAEARQILQESLEGGGGPELPVKEVWSFLRKEFALAVSSRMTLIENGAVPSMALALDMGDSKETFLGTMNSLMDLAAEMNRFERGKIEYRGLEIKTITVPGKRITICCTSIENLFVATLHRYYLQNIIDRHLDGGAALKDSPAFKRSLGKAGGENVDLLAFFNLKPILDMVKPVYPFEMEEWMDQLCLNQIDAVCLATFLDGGGSRDTFFVHCPGEKKGLLKVLSPHPVSLENLRRTPPDALYFMDVVFDPERLMKEFDGFVRNAFPEHYGEFRQGIDGVKLQYGFDLEKEILAPLGNEFSFFINMPQSGGMSMIPDMVLSISLDDEEGFKAVLNKLLSMAEGAIEVSQWSYEGRTFRHISPPDPSIPFSPTFTVEDGRFLLGSAPMTMKKYVRWLDKGAPGLDSTEEFKRTMASVPEEACIVEFANLRKGVGMAYGIAAPFLPTIFAQLNIPLDAAMLPMTETITEYLSNPLGYLVVDEEGIYLARYNPLGFGALLTVAISAADHFIEKGSIGGLLARAAVSEEPTGPVYKQDPQLESAFILLRGRDFEGAERSLTEWLDRHGIRGEAGTWALTKRGDCRMELEKYQDAATDYEKVVDRDRNARSDILYQIARAYALMDEAGMAIPYLEMAVIAGYRMFDHNPDLDNLKEESEYLTVLELASAASAYTRNGEYDALEQMCVNWIFENPYHRLTPWMLKTRAACFQRTGRYPEAIADFEKAVEREAWYKPQIFYSIACIPSLSGDQDRARDDLTRAIDAGFDDFDLISYDGDLDNIRNHPKFKALKWRW